MKYRFRGKILLFVLLLLALTACCAFAAAEEARNIAAQCTYTYCKGSEKNIGDLYNGNYSYYWQAAKGKDSWLEVTLPEGETCSGVQIKWYQVNTGWCVETEQNGEWVSVGGYDGDYLTTWTPLYNATKFRISTHNKVPEWFRILELEVYSAGDRPESVQVWQPTLEKADLMVVVAHPDDEYVFLGALIPYYGAERGKDVLVVYITESTNMRRTELLDGLWTAGQRTYPLLGKFYDRYTMNMETAYEKVGKKNVQSYMIELFRHYKPEVVVTHDINGEYGHGLHKICADIVINALGKSGDDKVHKASVKEYGTWDVPKCYIHLYGENQVIFDWKGMTLEAFGGKSAYEVADAAWQCHVSQTATGKYQVFTEGPYDSRIFGLYRSTVGEDTAHNDFFENIPDRDSALVQEEDGE